MGRTLRDPGCFDRITVKCVLGRFLEHERTFKFWMENDGNELSVLVGDFNSEPDTDVVRFVGKRLPSAYSAANGTEPDLTAPTPLNASEASRFATIDYIFVDQRLAVQDAWLTFTRADPDDDRLYASDHFGIAARVAVPSR